MAWTLTDHQNSVRDIVLKTGTEWAVENHLTYAATGEILDESGQTDSAFAWTGRYLDAATAKQYNTTRWYDLALSRWLSEDPIGLNSGDVNFYRYCGNDPVNWIDPSGLFWAETWAGIKGLGQGACNIGNGLQDTAIGILNLPATAVNGIAWAEEKVGILPEGSIRAPYIPSPDWSKDLVTHEGGTGWANSHEWSKGLGAGGVEILTGAAIGKVSKARQAARALAAEEALVESGTAKTGTALARELGKAGEDAAGIAKNTTRVDSLSGAKAYRIPDGLTKTTLTEVKNVARLDFTMQIQDSLHYAMMTGRKFVLVVRRDTQLSQPLIDAIKAGYIKLEYLP